MSKNLWRTVTSPAVSVKKSAFFHCQRRRPQTEPDVPTIIADEDNGSAEAGRGPQTTNEATPWVPRITSFVVVFPGRFHPRLQMCYGALAMTPRDHHFLFAKKLIPSQTFQSTDQMFDELRSAQREAFIFFLWNEAGKASGKPLPHVEVVQGPNGPTMGKLDVVGALRRGDVEVIVISMPPAQNPNEAAFLALVRRPGQVSVFTYERCRDDSHAAMSTTEAVLAELRPDGARLNHGFKKGVDLEAFKAHLGETLGISLEGLESSLPPVTVEDFIARGGGKGSGAGAGAPARGERGKALESLLLVRGLIPAGSWAIGRLGLGSMGLWQIVDWVEIGLSLVIGVMLLVWLHGVYADRRQQMPFSPGMAVGGWFIPFANFVLPWLIVRGAWRVYVGAGSIVGIWWLVWLFETVLTVLRSAKVAVAYSPTDDHWILFLPSGTIDLASGVGAIVGPLWSYGGLIAAIASYLLLWHIVRRVNGR